MANKNLVRMICPNCKRQFYQDDDVRRRYHIKFCSDECKQEDRRERNERYQKGRDKDYTISLRFKILARDSFSCVYCGRGAKDGVVLHVDHLIPRAKGGQFVADNLVTACLDCNIGKSDVLLEEHLRQRIMEGKVDVDRERLED